MAAIDRELQRALLIAMRDCFPEPLDQLPEPGPDGSPGIHANLLYLQEHGLCDAGLLRNMASYSYAGATITARGLDFLADDGGLSAILGVVTVKLHADTVRDLIAAKIAETPLPAEEKSALMKQLGGLSETALRAATTDLVRVGLDRLPDAIHWLRTIVGL